MKLSNLEAISPVDGRYRRASSSLATYFSEGALINYRVQNIEGLVRKLRENGITILDNIEAYEYGKFVHIMDPEGNKIELWEPIDSFLTNMGVKTTK